MQGTDVACIVTSIMVVLAAAVR